MTMVERIEDAISEACHHQLPPHYLAKCARAAIEAMREPTEAMKLAPPDVNFSPMDAEHAWHAMIEAALGKIDA